MEKLAVIFGGKSVERDISIITGLQVIRSIKDDFDVLPIFIDESGNWATCENSLDIKIYRDFFALAKKPKKVFVDFGKNQFKINACFKNISFKPDAVIVCMHGANGEDGAIAGVLQMAQMPYSCPNLMSCAICYDKDITKCILKNFNLPVVESLTYQSNEIDEESILKKIGFPLIVKPARLGSSVGVAVCKTKDELIEAVKVAKAYDNKIVFEKFLEDCREFNCAVLSNGEEYVCSNPFEVKSQKFYTFDQKYLTTKPLSNPVSSKSLSKKIKLLAEKVAKILDCEGVVRVDFLMQNDNLYVCEVNSIPGSLSGYLFGSLKEVIFELIEIAKSRLKKQKNYIYSFSSKALDLFAQEINTNKYAKK